MNPDKLIWILEDDPGAQFVYEEILGIRYTVRIFSNMGLFKQTLLDAAVDRPALLVADLRLPDESFLAFLANPEMKKLLAFPFMVVSSVDDLDALRLSFNEGALDYLTKPFGKGELVVKVERIFHNKLSAKAGTESISIDGVSLKVSRGTFQSSPLTTKELQILTLMQQAPQQTVSREEIISNVWNTIKVGAKTLDVHLFNLRRKLIPLGIEILYQSPNRYSLSLGDRVNK